MTFSFGLYYLLGKKLVIWELMTSFFFLFGLHYILGKKLVIWEVMTFFLVFTSLHFTVEGKSLGNRAGVSNLLNLCPPISKNGQFCRLIPPNAQHRFAPLLETRTSLRQIQSLKPTHHLIEICNPTFIFSVTRCLREHKLNQIVPREHHPYCVSPHRWGVEMFCYSPKNTI